MNFFHGFASLRRFWEVPVWDVSEGFPELDGVLTETACEGKVLSWPTRYTVEFPK